ncbi:hypothetical protein Vi05172_g5649 [Venturia inaequalis]|nr:hypothetical protein Vi05172_g5649 [Venturia inaequalis]
MPSTASVSKKATNGKQLFVLDTASLSTMLYPSG